MSITTISTTITTEVTPGAGSFAAILTIAPTGAIAPGNSYATALYTTATATGVTIVNFGHITGPGQSYDVISLNGTATLVNAGTIHNMRINLEDTTNLINSGDIDASARKVNAFIYLFGGTLTNNGTINTVLSSAGQITNNGLILGEIYNRYNGLVINTGTIISQAGIAVAAYSSDGLTNSGTIFGAITGAELFGGNSLTNTGHVWGGQTGVLLQGGAAYDGVTNAGTIAGGKFAILDEKQSNTAVLSLTVDPGAVFEGGVLDELGTGILNLAGTTAATLNMGGGFAGFSTIDFESGSTWTLEGAAGALAAGQTINGFAAGDTIVLEYFAATAERFVSGTGFVLSNGSVSETISLGDDFSPSGITITRAGTRTEFTDPAGPSETIRNAVTIGTPAYPSRFTIPSIGVIAPSAYGAAGAVALPGTYVDNLGTIIGAAGTAASQMFGQGGAAGSGISLQNGATLNTSGIITGGQGGGAAQTSGKGGAGGAGVVLRSGAVLTNTGTITGGAGGTGGSGTAGGLGDPGSGLVIYGATAFNVGAISAGPSASGTTRYGAVLDGGVLTNKGAIDPGATPSLNGPNDGLLEIGVLVESGTLFNSGGISGYDSVFFTGNATLEAAAGAVFNGAVAARRAFADALVLSPGAAGNLDMGSSFTGFSTIAFSAGTDWTLEGASIALAAGQSITGFLPGDTIFLDGFSASADSFAAGAGLILANATASETLAVNALPASDGFVVKSSAAGTTIAPVETIRNTGTLTGAAGQPGGTYEHYIGLPGYEPLGEEGGSGDNGLTLTAGTFEVNTGIILGGPGGYGGPGEGPGAGGDGGLGVFAFGGTLLNTGTIQGGAGGHGVNAGNINDQWFFGGGNGGDGAAGVYLAEGVTVTNTGTILGGGAGIGGAPKTGTYYNLAGGAPGAAGVGANLNGGTLINTGFIAGNSGVYIFGGILIDTGTIASDTDSPAIRFGRGAATLELYPGARLIGDAIANTAASDTLLLAGASTATAWIGTEFQNFTTISLAPGAAWTLAGTADQLAAVPTITGFNAGDTLEVYGFSATSQTYVSGTGLELSNASASITLHVQGALDHGTLAGTVLTNLGVACFCAGTRILTPGGNLRVEKLNIGDVVTTMHGPRPIRWIGRRAYAARFITNNPNALPIRIRRHAIAFNIPSRDLYVSPDHAIAEAGVLIHAHLLQNGISITQPNTSEDIEYFHLEFDTHTVIFAENLSTESFIDEGAKDRFQNSHTRPRSTSGQKPCLPRVFEGFHLQNIKSRLKARAGIQAPTQLGPLRGVIDEQTPTLIRGWAQNSAAPEHPVTLEIISGTQKCLVLANTYRPDLRAAGLGSGCHGFSLTLPNLTCPITIRRAPDGATLRPPTPRHCESA